MLRIGNQPGFVVRALKGVGNFVVRGVGRLFSRSVEIDQSVEEVDLGRRGFCLETVDTAVKAGVVVTAVTIAGPTVLLGGGGCRKSDDVGKGKRMGPNSQFMLPKDSWKDWTDVADVFIRNDCHLRPSKDMLSFVSGRLESINGRKTPKGRIKVPLELCQEIFDKFKVVGKADSAKKGPQIAVSNVQLGDYDPTKGLIPVTITFKNVDFTKAAPTVTGLSQVFEPFSSRRTFGWRPSSVKLGWDQKSVKTSGATTLSLDITVSNVTGTHTVATALNFKIGDKDQHADLRLAFKKKRKGGTSWKPVKPRPIKVPTAPKGLGDQIKGGK
jgi:hypothetical protein